LAGGTLTGALNGTTASFTGDITTSAGFFKFGNNYGIQAKNFQDTAYRTVFKLNTSNQIEIGRSTDISDIILGTASATNALTIATTGTATFSSSVTAQQNNISADGAGVVLQGYIDNNLRIAVRGSGYNSGARGGLFASIGDFSSSITTYANEGLIIRPTSGASYISYRIDTTSYSLIGVAGATSDIITGSALGDLNIRATNSQKILFSTNNGGSAAMTISSGGNLLVGTTTDAGFKLDVNGTGRFSGIVGINGVTEAGWGLKVYENLKVQNNNGTTVLQVADIASGGKAWSLISSGSGNVHSVPAGSFYLRNSSDGLTALSVTSAGNVGIGTSSVFAPLHLNANGNFSNSGNMSTGFVISNGTTGRALNLGTFDSGGYSWIQAAYVNNADTTFALTLQPRGGNVLIGTTTDNGARLQVSGTATFSSHVTGTCTTSFNGDGFRAIASATGAGGSQPGIGYWTAAGSKRFINQLDVASDTWAVTGATGTNYLLITQTGLSTFSSSVNGYGITLNHTSENLRLRMGALAGGIINIQGEVISSGGVYPIVLNRDGGSVGIGTTSVSNGSVLNLFRTHSANAYVPQLTIQGISNYPNMEIGTFDQYDGYISTRGSDLRILSGLNNTTEARSIMFYTTFNGATGGAQNYERMRITSGGYLKASNTGSYVGSTGTYHEFSSNSSNENLIIFRSSATSPYGPWINFNIVSPNNTTNYFLAGTDSTNDKFFIYSNGNMVNRNGSYGTISDVKFKENIIDANPKLEDILKLKVRNFNLIGEEQKQIGFIAQEFEEVFPSMVDTSLDRITKEEYKSIKTSVLIPMLVKAIQEQQEQINKLKNA
jgi:hypothetical protein